MPRSPLMVQSARIGLRFSALRSVVGMVATISEDGANGTNWCSALNPKVHNAYLRTSSHAYNARSPEGDAPPSGSLNHAPGLGIRSIRRFIALSIFGRSCTRQ